MFRDANVFAWGSKKIDRFDKLVEQERLGPLLVEEILYLDLEDAVCAVLTLSVLDKDAQHLVELLDFLQVRIRGANCGAER